MKITYLVRKIIRNATVFCLSTLLLASTAFAQQPAPAVPESQVRSILSKAPEQRGSLDWSLLSLYYLNQKEYDTLINVSNQWKQISPKDSNVQVVTDIYIGLALSSSGRIDEAKIVYDKYVNTDLSKFDTGARRTISGILSNYGNIYFSASPPDYKQALKYLDLALQAAEGCPTDKDILEICIPTYERKFAILFNERPLDGRNILNTYDSAFDLSKKSTNPQIIKYHIETIANLGNFVFLYNPDNLKEGLKYFQ